MPAGFDVFLSHTRLRAEPGTSTHLQGAFANYRALLRAMGKSDAEIEATPAALIETSE